MFLASESWLYQSSEKWFWWWPNSIVQLDILCSYRFGFSHQRFSRSPYSCRGGFDWEVFAFDSCIKSLILRKRSGVSFLNHLDTAKHVLPWVEAWFFPSRSQSEVSISCKPSGWKSVEVLPCNWSLMVRKFRKVLWLSIYLDVQTQFLRLHRFDLLHHGPNRSLFSCDKSVEEKVVECVSCIRILIVPRFQNLIFMVT